MLGIPLMKRLLLLALVLLASPAHAAAPLARLAEQVADEIVRTAAGRPVEIPAPEDRTSHAGTLALDLHALILARLEGRVALAAGGARIRFPAVLSESPGRLVLSGRVVAEPSGQLLDLISSSVAADDRALTLTPLLARATSAAIEVRASSRTPALDARVLDLVFVGEDRLLVLSPDDLVLYRIDGAALAVLSRRPLAAPLATVRAPAGMIALVPRDASLWVLTNRSPRAALFAIEAQRLVERSQAAALPWAGSTTGLRYRSGTNLIEGELTRLGAGPFLALERGAGAWAVSPEGQLLAGNADTPQDTGLRAGPALALLGPALLVTASADPPGDKDTLQFVARRAGEPHVVASVGVDGAIRALASQRRGRGRTVRLATAIETSQETYLQLSELALVESGS
jgi:hypothetical protein